jgi:predicted nucleotidyltransferase component of viral defense system
MLLEELLKPIIAEKKQLGIPRAVILNYLKEHIQYLVLNLIYNHPKFKRLVFKGGSCLRICYRLPRLSEDLDFDYGKKQFSGRLLPDLEKYLSDEIRSKHFSPLETKIQAEIRLYLKFPLLHKLGLAEESESNKLYVKIETENTILPEAEFDLTPISQFGFNFMAYHYDLPTLMTGKIHALLNRLWFKGKNQEIDIKGRDFYDLYWFLQNNIKPNWQCLRKISPIKNETELKNILMKRISKAVTPRKLNYDLKNFLPDPVFVSDFSQNYLKLIRTKIGGKNAD